MHVLCLTGQWELELVEKLLEGELTSAHRQATVCPLQEPSLLSRLRVSGSGGTLWHAGLQQAFGVSPAELEWPAGALSSLGTVFRSLLEPCRAGKPQVHAVPVSPAHPQRGEMLTQPLLH